MLSLGGRLTLMKVVLGGIPDYWSSLTKISSIVINLICRLGFDFLLGGNGEGEKFPLASWEKLSKQK